MSEEMKKPVRRNRGCEVLCHFAAVLAESLKKEGVPEHQSDNVSINVMQVMKAEFGGQNIYFPMKYADGGEDLAQEVYRKFSAGIGISELAFEYKYSVQWIYKLIACARELNKAKRDAESQAEKDKTHARWKREN